jgi:diguanylate cyclase (GGDEF)-like protein
MRQSLARIFPDRIVGRLRGGLTRGRALVLVGGWLSAAVAIAIAITVWDLRGVAVADGLLNTENLAIVLAKQTSHSVQTVDVVLRDVQDRIAALGITTREDFRRVLQTQEMQQFLRSRVERLPQLDNIALVGADGVRVNFSLRWPAPATDMSDRDYARHFTAADDRGLFISEPVVNRATFVWSLYLVRRVDGPHGEFLGMVLGSMPLQSIADLYQSINLPRGESIVLLRRDGTVLSRNLGPRDQIGRKLPAGSRWYSLVAAGGGHYESPGVFDTVTRMVAVQPLPDYPLVIDIGLSKDTALAHWRREATLIAIGTTIGLVCMMLMLHRLWLQFRRLDESTSVLTARNADLTRTAEALRASEANLAAISHELEIALTSMDQGLLMIDAESRVAVCNRRAAELLDLSGSLMASRPAVRAVPQLRWIADEFGLEDPRFEDTAEFGHRPVGLVCREHELADGVVVEVGCVPLAGEDGWVVTCLDITARRRAEQQVVFMARHDALTRLPNRVMFRERIDMAIKQTERAIAAAVLFLDLDHFKAINDTLGHPVGDGLLCAVAERLEACVRQVDTIARFGGDEFAVIQVGPERIEDVAILAQRISDVLSRPYEVSGHQVIVGVSIGIAMVPTDASDPDTLLKNADIALYRAKAEGRGVFRFFEPAMDALLQQRRILELDLHRALARDEFELFYQPLIDLATDRVCGFEALMRWNHPVRGLLKPDAFLATAEEMGLIVPLGRWALRTACREAVTWPDDIKVAVNLSPIQFTSRDLVHAAADALAESGLPGRRLNLEITEPVLLRNTVEVLGVLHELRGLGISISMDDFGTGYSSLSYLRSFPFDKIKIDQSFIRDLANSDDAAAIVRAVTSLGSALGMATTAEGVETRDQLLRLKAEGCTEVQGYLFSQARPAAEVPGLLRSLHPDLEPAI